MTEQIVIIGGVAAGPKTACRLKRLKPEAEITLIDRDSLISYGGCGIPYFVSGDVSDEKELRSTSFHMVRDERFFLQAKGVRVRASTNVISIDRVQKRLCLENLLDGKTDEIPYDKLVLATGSRPNRLPIPGNDLEGVFLVSNMHQAIAVKEQLIQGKVGRATVIGGGAIGIEMAEALGDLWGIETTILEFMPQLLPRILDRHFAAMVAHHLHSKGVKVHTGAMAQRIEADAQGRCCRVVTNKGDFAADLIIMAAGVRPNSELARDAGLAVAPTGGIVVNNRLQTSDPNIYAAGDCIETVNLLTGKKGSAPMGSLANRQGRVVADNLAGIPSFFNGWIGTFIMKAFDICVGATGLSLESARAEGFDAAAAISAQSDRAHFFPTQAIIPLQMVFDRKNRRVLGVQGFGPMNDAVLARINAAAALITRGATIEDFSDLEMAYAPPFATALDALNATANVADNIAGGRLRTVSVHDFIAWLAAPASRPDWLALDLRHPQEAKKFSTRFGACWLPLLYDQVRQRYEEIPEGKTLIIICNAGTRSYEIQCFLDSVGKRDTLVLEGGLNIISRMGPDWWPE